MFALTGGAPLWWRKDTWYRVPVSRTTDWCEIEILSTAIVHLGWIEDWLASQLSSNTPQSDVRNARMRWDLTGVRFRFPCRRVLTWMVIGPWLHPAYLQYIWTGPASKANLGIKRRLRMLSGRNHEKKKEKERKEKKYHRGTPGLSI